MEDKRSYSWVWRGYEAPKLPRVNSVCMQPKPLHSCSHGPVCSVGPYGDNEPEMAEDDDE
jgi:hypothetical protein